MSASGEPVQNTSEIVILSEAKGFALRFPRSSLRWDSPLPARNDETAFWPQGAAGFLADRALTDERPSRQALPIVHLPRFSPSAVFRGRKTAKCTILGPRRLVFSYITPYSCQLVVHFHLFLPRKKADWQVKGEMHESPRPSWARRHPMPPSRARACWRRLSDGSRCDCSVFRGLLGYGYIVVLSLCTRILEAENQSSHVMILHNAHDDSFERFLGAPVTVLWDSSFTPAKSLSASGFLDSSPQVTVTCNPICPLQGVKNCPLHGLRLYGRIQKVDYG